ncbi:hypothetical protein [uncultured Tenacibaculum sp.]|uniref:hypothetical protein n=1 Tax=uncultured Tenacibaculum sp. TaxID=174713 RepID=UPI002602BECE|nr:hypothetical protein [uncultured Tenacibaculum sp.]
MKKTFFLSKGLDKFSNLQINNLDHFKGGALADVPVEIYYPTSGGGKLCPDGMVWSDTLGRCVDRYQELPHKLTKL